MKTRRIIALLVLVLGIYLIARSGTQLLEAKQIFDEGNNAYVTLRERVVISPAPKPAEKPVEAQTQKTEQRIDFKALKAINSDAVAWLYCPNTMIDYPVVKASEYDYYLYHLLDHTYDVNGTLFTDYNNAPDFSDHLTVIYGHHMASGMMFGTLVGFKNQKYYEDHPFMYLYTEKGVYRVELIYGCVIGAGQWRDRAFMYQENLDELIAYAAQNTTFVSNAKYQKGDRVVAMSTCSYEFDNARYVVIGVLRNA